METHTAIEREERRSCDKKYMSVKQSRWCITHVDLIVKDLFKVNTAKKKKRQRQPAGKKKNTSALPYSFTLPLIPNTRPRTVIYFMDSFQRKKKRGKDFEFRRYLSIIGEEQLKKKKTITFTHVFLAITSLSLICFSVHNDSQNFPAASVKD